FLHSSGSSSRSTSTSATRGARNDERRACSTATRLRVRWSAQSASREAGKRTGTSGLRRHRDVADPATLGRVRRGPVAGALGLDHGVEPRLLCGRVLGDVLQRVLQHRLVVGANRTDVLAAPATRDDAGPAQDGLPEVEALLRANQRLLPRRVRLAHDALEMLGERREAVRRTIAVARGPVAIPVADGVAGTGLEAAATGRPQAERGLPALVGGARD